MRHDPRQIFQSPPKAEELFSRAENGDALLDSRRAPGGDRRSPLAVSRRIAQRFIAITVSRSAAIGERRANTREQKAICRVSRQSVNCEHSTAQQRKKPLLRPDIDVICAAIRSWLAAGAARRIWGLIIVAIYG